jgi:hypothetical protein
MARYGYQGGWSVELRDVALHCILLHLTFDFGLRTISNAISSRHQHFLVL